MLFSIHKPKQKGVCVFVSIQQNRPNRDKHVRAVMQSVSHCITAAAVINRERISVCKPPVCSSNEAASVCEHRAMKQSRGAKGKQTNPRLHLWPTNDFLKRSPQGAHNTGAVFMRVPRSSHLFDWNQSNQVTCDTPTGPTALICKLRNSVKVTTWD